MEKNKEAKRRKRNERRMEKCGLAGWLAGMRKEGCGKGERRWREERKQNMEEKQGERGGNGDLTGWFAEGRVWNGEME